MYLSLKLAPNAERESIPSKNVIEKDPNTTQSLISQGENKACLFEQEVTNPTGWKVNRWRDLL